MPINKKLLQQVKEAILANRERFDYNVYLAKPSGGRPDATCLVKDEDCGTIGCVAGFTCGVAGFEKTPLHGVQETAQYLLVLGEADRRFLFHADRGHGLPQVGTTVYGTFDEISTPVEEALKRIDVLLALPDDYDSEEHW